MQKLPDTHLKNTHIRKNFQIGHSLNLTSVGFSLLIQPITVVQSITVDKLIFQISNFWGISQKNWTRNG